MFALVPWCVYLFFTRYRFGVCVELGVSLVAFALSEFVGGSGNVQAPSCVLCVMLSELPLDLGGEVQNFPTLVAAHPSWSLIKIPLRDIREGLLLATRLWVSSYRGAPPAVPSPGRLRFSLLPLLVPCLLRLLAVGTSSGAVGRVSPTYVFCRLAGFWGGWMCFLGRDCVPLHCLLSQGCS